MKGVALFCLTAIVVATVCVYADDFQYDTKSQIRRAWYGGFMGYIRLPIKEDIPSGWLMVLQFRRRIKYLEICGAQIRHVTDDRRIFHCVNETWSGVLAKGDVLRMFFSAVTFSKVRGQVAKVYFYPGGTYSPVTRIPNPGGPGNGSDYSGYSTSAIVPRTRESYETVATGAYVSNFTTPSTATPTIGQPSTAVSGDVCSQTCGSRTSITSEWDGNFGGDLNVPVTIGVTGGWTLELWFQNRVTRVQIWNAKVDSYRIASNGDTVFSFSNQNWNYDLRAGSVLYLTFIASIPINQSGQPFYAKLIGQPECACG